MQDNSLDGCLSTLNLTLLSFLQRSDNGFGKGDGPRDVSYEAEVRVDLLRIDLSRYFSSIPSKIKKLLEVVNV